LIKQMGINIVFALAIKGAFLALGAIGLASMWEAVFTDVGVSLLAVLNAARIGRVR
jgi:Cd2+/Zn2+-exporting ATPase